MKSTSVAAPCVFSGHGLRTLAACVCLLAAGGTRAEWIVDASLGGGYDSNLSRAQLDSDIKDDGMVTASVSPGYFFQATDRTGVTLRTNLAATKFLVLGRLDNISTGVSAAVRTKLGLGAGAPWLRAAIGVAHDNFDHRQRDAWHFTGSASAGARFGTRLSAQVRYSYDQRWADDVVDIPFLVDNLGIGGDAFDIEAHSVSVSAMFDLNERLSILLGYTRRMGGVTSTTRRNSEIFAASDSITPDAAFGADRFAYRIDADTDMFAAGLSWALGDHSSINFGYQYLDSNAEQGLTYANHVGSIDLQFSY